MTTLGMAAARSMFRPCKMALIQLYIPAEAAQPIVSELGDLGLVQFRDLNADVTMFQRAFTSDIRKLDEMERKVRFLLEQAEGAEVVSAGMMPTLRTNTNLTLPRPNELVSLDQKLTQYEERIKQMNNNQAELEERFDELVEHQSVLRASAHFFHDVGDARRQSFATQETQEDSIETIVDGQALQEGERSPVNQLTARDIEAAIARPSHSVVGFVTGVIERRKLLAFERVLWRALRGNVYIRSSDLPETACGEKKSIFIAFVHGSETLARAQKICEVLGCSLHSVDADQAKREAAEFETAVKVDDVRAVLFSTRQAKKAELAKVAECLEDWLLLVRRQKGILDTMNRFAYDSDVATRKGFVAEGWCPADAVVRVDAALTAVAEKESLGAAPVVTVLERHESVGTPPTYFPVNRLTAAFQDVNDAYGVAKYGEMNPAVFSIITFPFLFAVMFGDVGHGALMTLGAALMCIFERRLERSMGGEIFGMIFGGRYMILLMGLFSIYAGFMYNDIFSKTIQLFPSQFVLEAQGGVRLRSASYVYPFGLDPAWLHAANGMTFTNSYKMKQSILLGLVQMNLGLVLSAFNMVYFGQTVDIFCVFLPQVLFMGTLFGYLGFLIVYKWVTGVNASILNLFIAMVLRFGGIEGPVIYPGQRIVQGALVAVAFACVPWMLLAKPVHLYLERRRLHVQGYSEADRRSSGESVSSKQRKVDGEHEQHSLGDTVVHQLIHTVEFVLSSVSNTASYLRLWALSLAHAQLSEVLWTLMIEKTMGSAILLTVGFGGWLFFTITVMVMMEGMSAFLHALRLQWVEFNNKFYSGTGVKFEPFVLAQHV